MNRLLLSFKHNLWLAAQKGGLKKGEVIGKHDVTSFELDVAECASVSDLAARALRHFCVENGTYNGFTVGVMAVMGFLEAHLKEPDGLNRKAVAFNDLRAILNQGGDYQAIVRWIESHYA